jgi:hypothetical protein
MGRGLGKGLRRGLGAGTVLRKHTGKSGRRRGAQVLGYVIFSKANASPAEIADHLGPWKEREQLCHHLDRDCACMFGLPGGQKTLKSNVGASCAHGSPS